MLGTKEVAAAEWARIGYVPDLGEPTRSPLPCRYHLQHAVLYCRPHLRASSTS